MFPFFKVPDPPNLIITYPDYRPTKRMKKLKHFKNKAIHRAFILFGKRYQYQVSKNSPFNTTKK